MKLKPPKLTAKIGPQQNVVYDDGEVNDYGVINTWAVYIDFGDGIKKLLSYLGRQDRKKKKVDEALAKYKSYATNIGAIFKRDYTQEDLEEMLSEAAESED